MDYYYTSMVGWLSIYHLVPTYNNNNVDWYGAVMTSITNGFWDQALAGVSRSQMGDYPGFSDKYSPHIHVFPSIQKKQDNNHTVDAFKKNKKITSYHREIFTVCLPSYTRVDIKSNVLVWNCVLSCERGWMHSRWYKNVYNNNNNTILYIIS